LILLDSLKPLHYMMNTAARYQITFLLMQRLAAMHN